MTNRTKIGTSGFAALLLLLIGILVAGCLDSTTSAVHSVSATHLEFEVAEKPVAGQKVKAFFKLKNSSNQPVEILKSWSACGCATVVGANGVIPPRSAIDLVGEINTSNRYGQTDLVYGFKIRESGKDDYWVQMPIQIEVKRGWVASQTTLEFDSQNREREFLLLTDVKRGRLELGGVATSDERLISVEVLPYDSEGEGDGRTLFQPLWRVKVKCEKDVNSKCDLHHWIRFYAKDKSVDLVEVPLVIKGKRPPIEFRPAVIFLPPVKPDSNRSLTRKVRIYAHNGLDPDFGWECDDPAIDIKMVFKKDRHTAEAHVMMQDPLRSKKAVRIRFGSAQDGYYDYWIKRIKIPN